MRTVRIQLFLRICAVLLVAGWELPLTSAQSPAAEAKGNHWAFKKLTEPKIPKAEAGWVRTPVDGFVWSGLNSAGLSPSKEADKRTLIRRVYLDLVGIPPVPEEVQAFIENENPNAYADLVEHLLASPGYGERWARHWLDVVRFAESNGFETNTPRPNAWHYRDYVIESFNRDKPYDQFIFEQLAGDTVGEDAATGFLVGGPWDEVKSPDLNLTLQQRQDELHDMISTTGATFLALTVGCARCHDHKFDPISQVDYYSMQAVFAGVMHGERPLRTTIAQSRLQQAEKLKIENELIERQLFEAEPLASPNKDTRAPVHAKVNSEKFAPIKARAVRFTIFETTDLEPCIDDLEVYTTETNPRNIALASAGGKASASGTYSGSDFHKLEHLNDGRYGNSRSWISNEKGKGWVRIDFAEAAMIDHMVWGRDREEKYKDRLATKYKIEALTIDDSWREIASSEDRRPYKSNSNEAVFAANIPAEKLQELKELAAKKTANEAQIRSLTMLPVAYAGRFEKPGPTYRLNRGEPMQKAEQVTPAALRQIGNRVELSPETPEQERRVALAKWIVAPENPLPARVMVNRIWQYHFGEGIVSTSSDFGRNGAKPSNPELLDWLATQFIKEGWSIKAIQRLIVLSNTYRQSSLPNSAGMKIDANDRLLWRFPPQRLEAEPLRDAILFVSGNLDCKMGGPGFDLFEKNDNYVRVFNPKQTFGQEESRRMIYLFKHRMRVDDTFGAFDCPDAGQIAPRRSSSTTPLQALNLLNSAFMTRQSEIFASRLQREAGSSAEQIRRGFELNFGRAPTEEELREALDLVAEAGLVSFCRALFNANEFLYVF